MGTFGRWAGGVLGLVFGGAVAIFGVGGGIKEAWQENEPGETNTEQFTRGFAEGMVDAGKGAFEGLTGAFDSDDVRSVLENAEDAGRRVIQGTEDYIDGRDTGRVGRDGAVQPLEDLPDIYIPGVDDPSMCDVEEGAPKPRNCPDEGMEP